MEVGEREEEEVKPFLFHRALSLRPANVCIRSVSYLSYREKSYFPVKNGERAWRKGGVLRTHGPPTTVIQLIHLVCTRRVHLIIKIQHLRCDDTPLPRIAPCFRHTTLSHIRVYTCFIKLIRDVSGKIPISRN